MSLFLLQWKIKKESSILANVFDSSCWSWPPFDSHCSACTYCTRDVTGNHSWFCLCVVFRKLSCRPPSSFSAVWHCIIMTGCKCALKKKSQDSVFNLASNHFSLLSTEISYLCSATESFWGDPDVFSLESSLYCPLRETGNFQGNMVSSILVTLTACSVVPLEENEVTS